MRREPSPRLKDRLKGKEELLLTGFMLAVGLLILVTTPGINSPVSFSQVGPRFFPYVVGSLLTVVSIWISLNVLRGGKAAPEESDLVDPAQRTKWKQVVMVSLVIVAHGLLVNRAGWVIATAFLFWGVAFALGSRHLIVDPVVALLTAVVIYVAFTRGLGVSLPAGPLEGFI